MSTNGAENTRAHLLQLGPRPEPDDESVPHTRLSDDVCGTLLTMGFETSQRVDGGCECLWRLRPPCSRVTSPGR